MSNFLNAASRLRGFSSWRVDGAAVGILDEGIRHQAVAVFPLIFCSLVMHHGAPTLVHGRSCQIRFFSEGVKESEAHPRISPSKSLP